MGYSSIGKKETENRPLSLINFIYRSCEKHQKCLYYECAYSIEGDFYYCYNLDIINKR